MQKASTLIILVTDLNRLIYTKFYDFSFFKYLTIMKNFYFVVLKVLLLSFLLNFGFVFKTSAQGIFYSAMILKYNNGSETYYVGSGNSGQFDIDNTNLGTFACNSNVKLVGAEIKTFKGCGQNVTGAKMYYRIYKASTTAPAFSNINTPFEANLSNNSCGVNDQRWKEANQSVDLISGRSDGNYFLEVYFEGNGSPTGAFYHSNNGANYKATFTINNPITITTSPTPPTVCFGSNTSISATATGNDAFIWQKQNGANWDNLTIAGATGSLASGATTTLNLSNVITTDTYRCLFTNCGGLNTQPSDPVTVTPQRPVISVQPASQADCDGNDIIFNVTASGTGTLTYQWQKKLPGGSFASVTGDANITVNAVSGIKVENIGNAANPHLTEYRCIITDGNTCTLTSDVAVMTVNKITTSTLTSQTICEGGNATFTLNTQGTTPSFQWQKRIGLAGTWTNISNGGVYSNTTTNALTITGATFATEHDTYYQCLVTFPITAGNDNGGGTVVCTTTSDNARLVVNAIAIPIHTSITEKGCIGVAAILNSNGCSPNITTWYDANNVQVGTGANLTITQNAVGSYTYKATCTNTSSGCTSVKSTGTTLIVAALPTISLVSVADICNNITTFNLAYTTTGSPNRYSIATGSPAMSGFANLSNTTTLPTSPIAVTIPVNTTANTYQFVVTARSTTTECISTPQNFTVKINATPTSPAVTSVNYCQNATTSALSATASGTNTLLWYGTNASGGTSSATAPTPSATTVGTVTYYVSQKTADNCESTRAAVAVVTNANPAAPVATTALSYCKNATATALTATVLGTNTLVWYDANDNILSTAPTPSTSTVGTQTFKVSQKSASPANCESPKTIIIVTINDLPVAPVATSPIGYCQNATATALLATATSPNTLLWYGTNATGGTSTASVTPLTNIAGTTSYYVSQKDVNNCEGSRAKIDVEITPTLTAGAISGINAFCTTGVLNNSTTLTANPTGGNGIYSYQWQNLAGNILSATNQTFVISAANTYQSVVTSGYCTATTSNSAVTAQGWGDVPNITGNTPEICGSGTKTLSIVSPSSSGVYKWFPDATTLTQTTTGTSFTTPNLTTTTTYYVAREQQITTNLVCQTVRTATTINVNATPTTPTIINSAGKTTFCNNETNFTLSVSCTSGNGQYRLNNGTWTSGNSVSINPVTYTSATTLNYDFKCALNATCESSTVSTSILINPVPNVPTISGATSICLGSSTTLTANGCTGTVIWSNGITNINVTVSASGTYTATCTVRGCVSPASDLQTIVVNAIPAKPTISSDDADNIVCAGTTTILTANGCTGTVIWSNGITNNNVTVSASGTYTATCTVSGCVSPASDLQTIVVNAIPAKPTISSDDADNIVCAGTNILLTANGCSGTVIWSNGITNNNVTVSASGTYTATCTVGGCVSPASDLQTIVVNAVPNAPTISGVTSICSGSSTTLTANGCTGTISWSTGGAGSTISALVGTYSATCTQNSCTSMASNIHTITENPLPTITLSALNNSCNSATSFDLRYTATTNSPDKYSLTSLMPNFVAITDANLPISPISVTIPAGQTGAFSFTLTQKISSTGCSKSQIFSVTILPVLTAGNIETSPTTTNCAGYDGLSISSVSLGSGGKTPYVYQWQVSTDGVNFTDISGATATTFDPDILTETNYFRRKISDACGEIKFSNVHQITIVPDPQITITDASDRIICSGASLNLSATTIGGFGTCVPTWQSSNSTSSGFITEQTGGLSLSKTLTNSTLSAVIKYFRVIYTCSGTGSTQCNDATSAVVKVTINPLPAVPTISGTAMICAGVSTTLTASGCNGNVVWSNAANTNAITVSSAGSYTAVCTNSCGTSAASNEIVVIVNTVNPPVLSGSTSICGGQIATLTASNCTGIVTWSNGSTGSIIPVSPSVSTSYTAICAENSCTSLVSNSVTVTVAPTVDFTVGTINNICNSVTSFSLPYTSTLGSPDKYSLTSNMPNFVAITDANLPISPISVTIPAGQTGTFNFTLTQKISSTGCSKSQTFSVTILPVLTAGNIETSPTTTNCAGYNGLSISSVSLGSGGKTPYVYQWQVSTDGVNFTDISGATATTFDPDILTETNYFRRKISDACGEIKFSNVHQITIVPDPQITITDASDKTLCSGASLNLSATTIGGFGTCVPTWQSSNSTSSGFITEQTGGLSLSKTLTNSTLNAVVKYFRVTYTCSGTGSTQCNDATSAVVKVTINYVPTAPIITPASVIICPTQSTLLTASGCNGTVLWASGQSGSTLSVSASGTYSAICSANNCVSTTSNVSTVTVASGGTPVPPPIISGTATICSGQSTNLTASACTGLVTWSNGNTGTSISVNPSLSSNYTATCFDGICTSNASNQITVTVNNYPTITTQPRNEADCNGNSVSFSVTASPATAYQWQRKIPNGTFTDISGATANTLTISNVGSASDPNLTEYKVIVSNATCSITSNAAVLTVNSVTGSIADKTICGGTNTTFDLTAITTTGTIQSYQWQKRVGTSGTWNDISGATATILNINNATNADEQYYRCKVNFVVGSSTCARYTTEDDSNGAKLTVLVASTPTISGNNTVCLGRATTLTANNCDGTISWSSGQSTASISVSPTVNTSYSVTCTSLQCGFMVSSAPYEVTVNATAQPINTTSDVITPATLVFSASTTVANATLLWYDRATGGTGSTTAPTFTAVGTYSYWVTQTNPLTACESVRLPIIAKVLDTFRITQQPATQADCKGNSVFMGVVAVGPNPTFTYRWQRKRPSEADFINLTDESTGIRGWFARSMAVSNVGDVNNPHLTQYRCIVSNGGQSLSTTVATLSVNSLSGSMPNLGICFGQTNEFNLQNYFTITGNVINYQWQTRPSTSGPWTDLSNGNGISGSTTSALKFSNATYEQGVYYRCLVKFNTQGFECTEPTDAAKLIVSGFPPAPSVSNIFYCQNSTAARLKVNSSVQNLVWYAQETGGTGSETAPIPSTGVAGNFKYYVTDRTDEGCESPRAVINVEVGALPAAPVNTTPSTISEGNILTFTADGSPKEGQVLHWFTSPTGTAFTTTAPTFTTAGTYTRYVAQLSAFSCLGSRTAITASIIPSLKFTKQPVSQADCDGNSVTFSVSASSPNGLTYQWQRQKPNESVFSNIPNEIANSLIIKNIDNNENPNLSKYRCTIKDDKGSVVSEEASLTVNKIIGTLSNVSLCDGNATKLNFGSLTLQGKIASYQWQKKMGDVYTDIPTNQEGTAIVNEAAAYRGRILFFVDEKNTCVRTTDDLKVEVKPTPVAPQVSNQSVCQNLAFSLEKSVTAANTLLWYDAVSSTTSSKITPKIDLNKVGKTTYFVTQITSFGCESERKSFDLVVSPVPAKPTANDISYCRNAPSIALTATTDRENALFWYVSSTAKDGLVSLIPDTKTDGSFNYFVSAKNTANCESERVGVRVNIAPCIATFDNNFSNCVQVSTDDVKGNRWYDLYDNAGKLYASVNPNGLDLGKVSISIRHYGRGSGAIPKTQNDTKFMARYVDFQSSTLKKFEKPVSLRIFYQNDELTEYKTASNLLTLTIQDFNIVHYDGKNEDCGFENNDNFNDGNSEVIYKNVVGNQLAKDFFYLQFDVNTFSENGATANDFTEISFTGKPTAEKNVQLNWQTKFETKAEKFILERSADCKNFVALTEIKANGVSSTYEKVDYQPLTGKNCYRLVYIDKDGTKKYLDGIEVNFTDAAPICSVFPNPWNVGDVVNLYLRNIKEKEIKLYDMLGQAYSFDLKKDEMGIIRIRPDVQLNKGMHFVVVLGEDGKKCVQKIVINP